MVSDENSKPHGSTRYRKHVHHFWERVTEGIELQALWSQFKAEARTSYGLYSREVDWAALQRESRWRRPLKIARALFLAMLMRLSPARRVLLLIALLLIIFGQLLIAAAALLVILALELADRVTMKRDLEIAREIQGWLVPEVPPEVPGVDIAFATRPANTVGGDYYDVFFRSPDQAASASGCLLLVVADVAGKSVPAALLMATFQASLRVLAGADTSLGELVLRLNRYACTHSLSGLRFTTGFIAELDPGACTLSYINAGHDAPILRRASGHLERLEEGGLPFGIDADTHYDSRATRLTPGDLVVIFTDGLVEAVNEQGEEYGVSRLLESLNARPHESAAETLKRLMSAVDTFIGSARQHDDITCLVLRAI